ncbi:MAG: TolC family protein [Calditrichaceae bacterium]
MNYKWILKISLILLFISGPGQAQESLDNLIDEALRANPDIQRVKNQLDARKYNIGPAGSLPDPVITFGLNNLPMDTYSFDQEPMTQKTIGLMQMFPFWGKLTMKQDIAEIDALMGAEGYDESKLQIIRLIKNTYYDLYYTDRAINITNENRLLLENVIQVATIKYQSGKGIQRDLLQSQLEQLKLDETLEILKQQESTLKARMNILLNRAPDQPIGNPQALTADKLDKSLDQIIELSLQKNPMLKIKDLNTEKTSVTEKLKRREYWPDISLTAMYGQRENRPDFLSATVSLSIPIYAHRKQSQKIQEAAALNESAKFEYENTKNEILYQIKVTYDNYQKNLRLLALYETQMIPQSQQAYESAISAYSNDRIDYTSMIDNLMTLYKYQLARENVLSVYNKNMADLEFLAGGRK